jgi:uncharacterized membrane protein
VTPVARFTIMAMLAALAIVLAATVIGLIANWPSDRTIEPPRSLVRPKTESAEVVGLTAERCRVPGQTDCRRVTVRLTSGKDKGKRASFQLDDTRSEVRLSLGDSIRVYENPLPEGAQIGGVQVDRYGFSDFERRSPLLWLALGFAALVLVTGRLQGLRALIGLGGSLLIVVFFVVPAILDGHSPASVALFGGLAVMFVTIPLAHGFGVKTVAACLGTTACLLLVLGLAEAFTDLTHLTGLASEEAIFLRTTTGELSVQGLLLAGMVIGALGVLDDLTVSQASTVMALRRANPALRFRELFAGALAVGRDHITATVNTLVLAYAGASLPVLLIFSLGGTSFTDAVNTEAVAAQVVATLVGSIGLIAAVPVTTALAALLATNLRPAQLGGDAARHAH